MTTLSGNRAFTFGQKSRIWLLVVLVLLVLLPVLAYGIWMVFFFSFDGPPLVQEVALADLNDDGHLDAFVTISPRGEPYVAPDRVLFGDGNGRFTDSGQRIENVNSFAVALGDISGDGVADAVVGPLIYANDGNGRFNQGSYGDLTTLGTFRWQLRLADLNGDGALDVFGAGCCGGTRVLPDNSQQILYSANEVLLNNGSGRFGRSEQLLGQSGSNAAALGDVNGDGFIDAFVANGQSTFADGSVRSKVPNTIWLNDGSGQFSDNGERLGAEESTAVALGDLDGDGDLDAVVGNNGRDELWLNDGVGHFTRSPQSLGTGLTRAVFVHDLNGDGAPDLIMAGEKSARIWLNNGSAKFQSGQRIRYDEDNAIAPGDVNNDGVMDLLVAGVGDYRVWLGDGSGGFTAVGETN